MAGGQANQPSGGGLISQATFEGQLQKARFKPTAEFSPDGKIRIWLKPDGQRITIPVFPQYPEYMFDKILEECGMFYIPLYNSMQ